MHKECCFVERYPENMNFRIPFLILCCACCLLVGPSPLFSQSSPIHPRGLILPAEVAGLRERLEISPLKELFAALKEEVNQQEALLAQGNDLRNYELAYLLTDLSALYLFTDDTLWAKKAYQRALQVMADPIFRDPFSRGLTRATLLHQLAIAYDFCYNGWSEAQRTVVNDALFDCMVSVNANMGFSANYSIASNWMGVRFGSVVLAARVWDDPEIAHGQRSLSYPLMWDATKRLQEHVAANVYRNGWNGESLGYHNYAWSFVGPALVALQNQNPENEALSLASLTPKAVNSLHAQSISTLSIPRLDATGLKLDLSDDNLNAALAKTLAVGFRIYPEAQHPSLKWMYDYLLQLEAPENYRNSLMYGLLYYPLETEAENPAAAGWTTYHDPEQGIVILRNRFLDQNDIVFAYTATATRVKGHKGPDTNTFRLIGLGVPWIIGGGRTNETAVQTNLFPSEAETAPKNDQGLGKLLAYGFEGDQSAYAWGEGSCVGTKDHRRFVHMDYGKDIQAQAAFVIADSSANGRRWRIQTPEFMEVSVATDGYTLTAPNGSSLQVTVLSPEQPNIEVAQLTYGGSTVRLNPGIQYEGKAYSHSHAIDVQCDGQITVVMTLQEKGDKHPRVRWNQEEHTVVVGRKSFVLNRIP